jgi:RNA polymerase sigma-70 factor (ECF subfamily)
MDPTGLSQSTDRGRPGEPVPDELAAMYRSEFRFIFHSLRRLGIAPRDLEDLTHDVFFTAYKRMGTYDRARPLKPWLFGIAFRLAKDFRALARQGRELPESPDGPEPADERPLPDENAAARQDRDLVMRALQRIELSRRAVFVMHDLEGLPAPEIAEALEIPLGTAYSRLRQARQEFAEAVYGLRGGAR